MGIKTVITLYPKRQNRNINERMFNLYIYIYLTSYFCFPSKNNEEVLKSNSKVSNV